MLPVICITGLSCIPELEVGGGMLEVVSWQWKNEGDKIRDINRAREYQRSIVSNALDRVLITECRK